MCCDLVRQGDGLMPVHTSHIAAYYYHRVHNKIYASELAQIRDWDNSRYYAALSVIGFHFAPPRI